MVPDRHPPGDEFRSFSPEVEAALEAAMSVPGTGEGPSDALRDAIKAAARDARQRMLRAEEMLVAFKQLEQRLARRRTPSSPSSVEDRARIIRALIEAYYLD